MSDVVKILYRKNLNMSTSKVAAQCVHAALLMGADHKLPVIVLGVSNSQFQKQIHRANYIVTDAGKTEVAKGTVTCMAFYDKQKNK